MHPNIIVCGLGQTGYRILTLLRQQGAQVMGVSDRPLPTADTDILVGDMQTASTLLAAGIQKAHTLVLAGDNDAVNLAILTQARILNPRIRIINRLFNTSLGDRLDRTLPNHVSLSVSTLAAPLFAFTAQGNHSIGQLQLLGQTWPMQEEYIDAQHSWLGRPLRDLWDDRNRMLIYYLPVNHQTDLISAIEANLTLQRGDRLILGKRLSRRSPQRSRRPPWRRWLTALQYFLRHGQPMLLVSLALLFTILVATFTYVWTDLRTSIVDALYFAVGMITGAGGNEKVVEMASDQIKLFTVIMMLVGAGVIGICYALLNDYVLGTRFRRIWEVVAVPDHDHYIVCGLGGIGSRLVSHLHASGHEVVVIEKDPANRFLYEAHALKVPVIQSDANLSSTLAAAHLPQAAALIAVTSDDTVNLEIALTVKSLAPHLPIVVRIQDPAFAQRVKQVFGFDAVLSPTELAAPAFAAAALGDRILGNGRTGNSLWVALATVITPEHPFCDRSVKDVAMTADLVPLYVETAQNLETAQMAGSRLGTHPLEARPTTVHGWFLLDHVLRSGDTLYLTLPAQRLQELGRTPATGPVRYRESAGMLHTVQPSV